MQTQIYDLIATDAQINTKTEYYNLKNAFEFYDKTKSF